MHMYVYDIIWKVETNFRNLNKEKFSHITDLVVNASGSSPFLL